MVREGAREGGRDLEREREGGREETREVLCIRTCMYCAYSQTNEMTQRRPEEGAYSAMLAEVQAMCEIHVHVCM